MVHRNINGKFSHFTYGPFHITKSKAYFWGYKRTKNLPVWLDWSSLTGLFIGHIQFTYAPKRKTWQQ